MAEDCDSKFIGMRINKPKPPITTPRRRELLALAIELVDKVLAKTEPHERRLFFKMTDQQLVDVNNSYDGD